MKSKALELGGFETAQLGTIVGELMKLMANNRFAHLDIDMWNAPSECHELVDRGIEKAWNAILTKFNITEEQIREELVKRGVPEKNIHFGFNELGWADRLFIKKANDAFGKYWR